jgi:hypothetical protein
MLCPKCKTDGAHRSHRAGLTERLVSIVGFFPYNCGDCHHRFLWFRHSSSEAAASLNPSAEREIAATRSARGRRRKQREILLYGLALLLFAAILYFLTRPPSAGA